MVLAGTTSLNVPAKTNGENDDGRKKRRSALCIALFFLGI